MNNNDGGNEPQSSSDITGTEINNNACQICGREEDVKLLMTCYVCNNVRQHSNCVVKDRGTARDQWRCELCCSIEPANKDLRLTRLSTDKGYRSDGSHEVYSARRRTPPARRPGDYEDTASSSPPLKKTKLDHPESSSKK